MVPSSISADIDDIVGVYEPNFDEGLYEMIQLRPDSTYIRLFVDTSGKIYKDSSIWTIYLYIDSLRNDTDVSIHLSDFNDYYNHKSVGGSIRPMKDQSYTLGIGAVKDKGKTRLSFETYGRAYIKLD